VVLAYHRIAPKRSSYLYSISSDQLDAHLKVVAELRDAGQGADLSTEVTFDDGHRSNYVYGRELLQKHSVKAIFFVTAGWMGSQDGFMNWPELREVASLGHSVQSHGWSHRVLTQCSQPDLLQELQRSREVIEDQLNSPVESISVPHGRWNNRVLGACAAAGYRRVYVSDPWLPFQIREGVELVGRYMVRRSIQARALRRLLERDRTYVLLLRSQHVLKETVRRLVGYRVYRALWSALAASDDAYQ
jgi:peptidoglycan/xylan/chitin deacetylase (PgdA/CDA1 family)